MDSELEEAVKRAARCAKAAGNMPAAMILLAVSSTLIAGDAKGLLDLALACGPVAERNLTRLVEAKNSQN